MAIVTVVSGGPKADGRVFVSLEHTPVVLAEIRAGLPQLKEDLCKRWPVEHVEIENRIPRLRNPIDPGQIIHDACIGIVILFFAETARAAAKKIGENAGDEISKYVRDWIQRVSQTPPAPNVGISSQKACECGCGGHPKNPKSRFLPGHDLRKAYNETGGASRRAKKTAHGS